MTATENSLDLADGNVITVLTVNLCILVSGLTNRHLPKQLLAGAMIFMLAFSLTIAIRCSISLGLLAVFVVASPLLLLLVMWAFGLPLARFLGPLHPLVGLNDFKRERVDLFLKALQERAEFASVDVICIQECYSSIMLPGSYPEMLLGGARKLGFEHSILPPRVPTWPAILAQNSGLAILSKKKIKRFTTKSFGLSLESGNVNRGALHALLEDGTHIFTCHIAPSASVAGDGLVARAFSSLVEWSRKQQVLELVSFIKEQALDGEPIIVAGDFNVGIHFTLESLTPNLTPDAEGLVRTLSAMCNLDEISSLIRGRTQSEEPPVPMQFCKPTFGYVSPLEVRLTSYGTGKVRQICDDAVFARGFTGLEFSEIDLSIPPCDRPHKSLTHLSDHWSLVVKLCRQTSSPTTIMDTSTPVGGYSALNRAAVDESAKRRLHGCSNSDAFT